jgi:hypothetical protein
VPPVVIKQILFIWFRLGLLTSHFGLTEYSIQAQFRSVLHDICELWSSFGVVAGSIWWFYRDVPIMV